jgi:hypothetical protein
MLAATDAATIFIMAAPLYLYQNVNAELGCATCIGKD